MVEMNQFESPYARVFLSLNNLVSSGMITMQEKGFLKDLIIQNDQRTKIFIQCSNLDETSNQILSFLKSIKESIEELSELEDDNSTSKSLRRYLIKKLRLDLKHSNFKIVKKIQ